MALTEDELKNLLMKVKEESGKVDLKLNIQRTKIMASGPISSWQIDGETMETVTDFIFLSSKITADGDCSHEIKKMLLRRTSYDKARQCIKKQRHYFVNKGPSSQGTVFPVVMYECESRTIKKAECRKIYAFELWCCKRVLRVFGLQGNQTSQSSRKSILNIHWKD